uniref:Uncharacterized protein n=1 Tax=Arundo donax TaxID=35708 RepID=A0A0A8XWS4_ARUDO
MEENLQAQEKRRPRNQKPQKLNISLLCKWWWKLEKSEGIWQEIVRKKYVGNKCISQIKHKATDSPVWSDLLKVRKLYLRGRVMLLGNGTNIDFWNDIWCKNITLCEKFAELFQVNHNQQMSVAYLANKNWHLDLRRWPDELIQT